MSSLLILPYFHGTIDIRECREALTSIGDFLVRNHTKTVDTKFDECPAILTIAIPVDQSSEKEVKDCSLKMDTLPRLKSYPIQGDATGVSFTIPGTNENFATIQTLCDSFMASKKTFPFGGQLLRAIPRKPWQLLLSDITFPIPELLLGKGSFGKVVKGKLVKSGVEPIDVAIKSSTDETNLDIFSEMYTEARIMRALSHPNIIKLEGVIVEKIPIMLVIEYLEGSCLSKALIANKVPNETRFPIVMGILYGLQYMHQHGFIHRDIAARNVMVSNDCRTVKIIDFGLAKHGLQFTLTKCSKIPAKWLAPEILDKWTFTPKSDTWAFGVCIWEIYHDGAEPYADTPGFKASSSEPEGPQGKTPTATTPLAKTPNAATPAGSTPTNPPKNSTVKRATKTPKLRPELMITKNAEWVPQDFMPIYKRMHDINVDRRIELSAMAEEIEKKILPTLPPAVLIEAKIHMEKRPPFDSKFKVDLSSHLSKGSPSAPPSKGSKKAEYVPINKTARRKNPNRTRSRSKSTGDSTGPSTGTTSSGSNPGHKSADKTHTKKKRKKELRIYGFFNE